MEPATSLSDANLPKDSFNTQTPQNAVVAGNLVDGMALAAGSFGFTVNLSNGNISGASMDYVYISDHAHASGGTGVFSAGSFSIGNFHGAAWGTGYSMPILSATTSMSGTGSVANVGDSVSGNWFIDLNGIGTYHRGTMSGNRIQ